VRRSRSYTHGFGLLEPRKFIIKHFFVNVLENIAS
jgi:hypothetical protein